MTRGESGRRCEELDCACCVRLKPKQIKYLNSTTAARLQPNEREACRSERQVGDEENEQVVEPNEKEKQDSGKGHPHHLGRVGGGDDERPPAPSRVVRGGRWSVNSLLTSHAHGDSAETNEERKAIDCD